VPAAARLSTPDSYTNPKQLIRVDGTPIIIHLLKDLHSVGIERVVITLGYAARELREEVTKEEYGGMLVEFVVLQESSWKRGHASSILAARSMFPAGESFLIIMSDYLFDRRLIASLTVRRHGLALALSLFARPPCPLLLLRRPSAAAPPALHPPAHEHPTQHPTLSFPPVHGSAARRRRFRSDRRQPRAGRMVAA
jgi:hypothetical protein